MGRKDMGYLNRYLPVEGLAVNEVIEKRVNPNDVVVAQTIQRVQSGVAVRCVHRHAYKHVAVYGGIIDRVDAQAFEELVVNGRLDQVPPYAPRCVVRSQCICEKCRH